MERSRVPPNLALARYLDLPNRSQRAISQRIIHQLPRSRRDRIHKIKPGPRSGEASELRPQINYIEQALPTDLKIVLAHFARHGVRRGGIFGPRNTPRYVQLRRDGADNAGFSLRGCEVDICAEHGGEELGQQGRFGGVRCRGRRCGEGAAGEGRDEVRSARKNVRLRACWQRCAFGGERVGEDCGVGGGAVGGTAVEEVLVAKGCSAYDLEKG